jgi:lipopolysaccharide transport system ATP-binding protein
MDEVLIVESVSKQFQVHRNRPTTLKETVVRRLRGIKDNRVTTHWALRDVSFSVEKGKTLGLIGHNGAGKSTLLRLVCGLGRPTTGRIQRRGHMGSMLELGSGFNPELTGRENLITGGILSGLTRRQIKAGQDEIISFAELEEFIDQPVRTYSSGMYLRLAFATAIHFDPDFLVIDEVLAVGDSRFQQKCRDRLNSFRAAGKSFILVSHDIEQVRSMCDEVLVLEEGRVMMHGDPESAVNCYHDLMRQRTERRAAELAGEVKNQLTVEKGNRQGTQEASICSVSLFNGDDKKTDRIYAGSNLAIEFEYFLQKPLPDMALVLGVFNETNMKCFETYIPSVQAAFGRLAEKGSLRCLLPKLPLLPGQYYVNLGLWPPDWSFIYDYHWQMHPLTVVSENEMPPYVNGVIMVSPNWSVQFKD